MKFPQLKRRPRTAPVLVRTSLALCVAVALGAASLPAPGLAQEALRGDRVTLSFANADLEATVRTIGAYTGKQFLLDPRVKGTLNLVSEKPLERAEVLKALYASLRMLGFAAVEVGNVVRVVPEADAKLLGGTVGQGTTVRQRGDVLITQTFRLQNESAQNMLPVLRPLISPNNTINAFPGNNSLVITDYAENVARLAQIIATLDAAPQVDAEIIPVTNASAVDLANTIQRLTDNVQDPAQRVTVLADPRTNGLIVRAPSQQRLNQIKLLIARLDTPGTGAGNLHFVSLKNAEATRLAQTLSAILGGPTSSAGASGGGSQPQPMPQQANPLGGGGAAAGGATQPSANFGQNSGGGLVTVQVAGGVSITADPATNSLIVRAPAPVYRDIRAVIERLDQRRAQVLIEGLIVEVSEEKISELGIQWAGLTGSDGSRYRAGVISSSNRGGAGLAGLIAGGTAAAGSALNTGFNLGIFRNLNGELTLGAIARVLQSDAGGNVLSRPQVMTLDNEEARIIIGENVPFVTGSFTNTGGGGASVNPFQTIERRDVGLTLRVKPQISEGGVVRMAIFQEDSAVRTTGPAGPTTSKRAVETNVLVDDRDILILGGLIRDTADSGVDKVPLLGDIPVIGSLFRYDKRERRKTNLLIFIRPTVIRDANSARSVVADRYEEIRALQRESNPNTNILLPGVGQAAIPELPAVRIPPTVIPAPAGGTAPPAPATPGSAPAEPPKQ